MRLAIAILVGVAVLTVIMAMLNTNVNGPMSIMMGDPKCYYTGRIGDGVYRARFDVLLASPSNATFAVYMDNGEERSIMARAYLGDTLLFEESIPPGRRAVLGKIVFESGGHDTLRIEVDGAGFPCNVKVDVVPGGGSGYSWILYAGLLSLGVLSVIVGVFLIGARGALWGWLPGLIGLSVFPAYAYYHGPPRPMAVDLSVSFGSYYTTMWFMTARSVVELYTILVILVGVLAAYYPRGSGWDSGEALYGKWGPWLAARRILIGSIVGSLAVVASFLVFLVVDGVIGGLRMVGWDSGKVILVDIVCLFIMSMALATLFSGLSFATRSPLLALVLGVLLVLTVLKPPCVLGQIEFGSSATGGAVASIGIATKMRHFIDGLPWYAGLSLVGVFLWVVGWLRR